MKHHCKLLLSVLCTIPAMVLGDVTVTALDTGVKLSGNAMALEFDLAGGRCTNLLAAGAGRSWVVPGFGGFELHLADQYAEGKSDYGQAKYIAKTLNHTPEEATVELAALGKQGNYGFCEVRKRVTVSKRSPVVRVEHEFYVGEGAVVAQYPSFMFVQSAPPDARITVPAEDGGQVTVSASSPTAKWKLAQGWVAVQRGDEGVVYRMPMEDIQYVGVRSAADGLKLVWRTITRKIDAGRSVVWPIDVIPFRGLAEVNGAGPLGCGRIEAGGVTFLAVDGGAADLEVATRTSVTADWKPLPSRKVTLVSGLNTIAAGVPAGFSGQVRVRLAVGSREAVLYRVLGNSAAGMALPLQAPRMAEAATPVRVRDVDYNDFLPTPHVPWAKPMEGTPLKVFCSWGELGANRMVNEIMQRMDAGVDTVTMASGLNIGWGMGGPLYGSRNKKDIDDGMKGYLGGDRPYDVIVLAGLNFPDHVGETVGARILERVRNGAGLVFAGMFGMPKWFSEQLPVKRSFGGGVERWTLKAPGYHPVTAGLPVDRLSAGITKYLGVRSGAEVLAIAGTDGSGTNATENPAIVTATLGKGRVVVLGGIPEGEEGMALLAKAMLWAAGREPGLRITSLASDKAEYAFGSIPTVSLHCASETAGDYEVVMAGKDGAVTNRMQVAAGSGHVEVSLPAPPCAGEHRVDVLISRAGTRVNFGVVKFDVAKVKEDLAVRLDAASDAAWGCPVYRSGAAITGTCAAVSGYESVAELVDIHDRVLDRRAPDGKGRFVLAAAHADRPQATVRVSLMKGGRVAQRASAPVVIGMSPDLLAWDEMQVLLYGSGNDTPRGRVLLDAVDPWGVGALLRPFVWVGVPSGIAHVDTGAWDSLLREYGKTKDVHLLYRVPCINSTNYVSLVQEICRKRALSVGALAYVNGDEQSFTSYTREFDFCFTPDCLREFRRYLAGKYGTLEKLNAIWGTRYADFQEITPPLTDEARQDARRVPAWNDFRIFNNLTFAKGYRMILDELRKVDPSARLGISGSQGPAAFGGYDYTRLMKVFDMLMEYGGWEDLQMAVNPRVKFAPATGYSGDYPAGKGHVWNMLSLGGAGVSYYDEVSGIYPTLRLAPGLRGVADAIEQMRPTGLSKLIMTADRTFDPVAVYYSHESINAGFLSLGGDVQAGNRWLAMINGGTTFLGTYLTRETLLAGAPGVRVIAMVKISSASDEELAALRAFMDKGGFVLGDDTLGVVDQYLRRRTDRTVLESLRKHSNYVPIEQVADAAAMDRFLRERVRLSPTSDMAREDGGLPGVRISTFRNGPLTYTVTGANGDKALCLAMNSHDRSFIYDCRAGTLLGQGKVMCPIPPYESAVLAKLPYRVSGVELSIPARAGKGSVLAVKASVKASAVPGTHVLAFTVTDPAGVRAIPSRWRVTAPAGAAETSFFVPYNAPSGQWRIEVRDAATGIKSAGVFAVE